ncbi:MAG: long-chain fatty acid transporter [Francisellaceae bacterium]|nr:long-chain fatty acid transporter [Francisellaceae bacterium]
MNNLFPQSKIWVRLLSLVAVTGISQTAFASGFALNEHNVSNLGLAYAGTASMANDASTNFYNAAGLVKLGHQNLVLSSVGIITDAKFIPSSANATDGSPMALSTVKPRGSAVVPAFHYAQQLNDKVALGLTLNSPFGLETKYADTTVARYAATRSEIRTLNISPSIAFKIDEHTSVGVGADALQLRAWLNAAIGNGTIALDGYQNNYAKRWGYGWHAGVLSEFQNTKIGLAYRSQIKIKAQGSRHQKRNAFAAETVQSLKSTIKLPDMATFSVYQDLNSEWAMTADLQWTHWAKFKQLVLNISDATQTITNEQFKNAYRASLGALYKWDNEWTLKAGLSLDKTPVRAQYRTARLPDSDRIWLALGARYQVNEEVALDFGYAHLFFKKASLADRGPTVPHYPIQLNGKYKTSANLIGIQLTWNLI